LLRNTTQFSGYLRSSPENHNQLRLIADFRGCSIFFAIRHLADAEKSAPTELIPQKNL
jgi:hypothetical protein